ncbi:hypothetical protein CEE34_00370 [Candidatus Aerophobetes bacterium Ae_b3a]|nr:MAG: hypothetical protein CEE34_00370 [Candidatus Aerophobetes bacterium Ae_b3a]
MEGWLFLAYCPKTESRFLAVPKNPIVDTAVLWITFQVTHITWMALRALHSLHNPAATIS